MKIGENAPAWRLPALGSVSLKILQIGLIYSDSSSIDLDNTKIDFMNLIKQNTPLRACEIPRLVIKSK